MRKIIIEVDGEDEMTVTLKVEGDLTAGTVFNILGKMAMQVMEMNDIDPNKIFKGEKK